MIHVVRGSEPSALPPLRREKLRELRKLARTKEGITIDIRGYQIAADPLWRAQHRKCCYCELKIQEKYQDVEHYRPKMAANREPGSAETHGYWWLAYTWKNLLLSCNSCNRLGKHTRFPLDHGSTALCPCAAPPGLELPLLIDPAAENPVKEIVFECDVEASLPPLGARHWIARPRNGSVRGAMTIEVLKLNRGGIVELRDEHVAKVVRVHADALRDALERKDPTRVAWEHARASALFEPGSMFAALSYDALREMVPGERLADHGLGWPEPEDVAMPAPPPRARAKAKTPSRRSLPRR